MDLLEEHSYISLISLCNVVRIITEWFLLGGGSDGRRPGGWSAMLVLFCLTSVLVMQVSFLCEKSLSGSLKFDVKLK